MSEKELLRVKQKYEGYLLGIEGVTGVGVNGSIIIYVERDDPKFLSFIPKSIDGVPVKIIKAKPRILGIDSIPIAAGIYADRVSRVRPVPGGVSIGRPEATGTFTCKGINKKTEEVVGITNNHVGALVWGERHVGKVGDELVQPGPVDGGIYPDDVIGFLDGWVPVYLDRVNPVDVCWYKSAVLADYIEEVGRPAPTIEPQVGMKLIVSSRTGLKYTTIIDKSATLKVEGWGTCTFGPCIVTQFVLVPGDSGSWGGEVDTYSNVGIGFAGDTEVSCFNYASIAETLIGASIIPPIKPLPFWTALGIFTSLFSIAQIGMRMLPTIERRERNVV